MRGRPVAARTFTTADQQRFAKLSGDANPMHVDPVAARRLLFGAPVVHGVHTVLWTLDEIARRHVCAGGVKRLDVRFRKPTYVGDAVTLSLSSRPCELAARVLVDGIETTSVKLRCDPDAPQPSSADTFDGSLDPVGVPSDLDWSEMDGRHGIVRFAAEVDAFGEAFPYATALLGAHRLRGLAALSRLVGMECPGLHSIFTLIRVELVDENDREIHYRVTSADPRFNALQIGIDGGGFAGHVQAFVRPRPIRQMSAVRAAEMVPAGVYRGHHALVVGGSRGLGELTAKLVAAGGGEVILTYAVGKADAEAVAEEIRRAGGSAATLPFDATAPAAPQLDVLAGITHIYYFATPRITSRTRFDPAAFDRYTRLYVAGFHDLVTALADRSADGLRAFFPSTVFIDENPGEFGAYVVAKAAGEALCAHLNKHVPGVVVVTARLPKVLTDQTNGLTSMALPSTAEVMRPLVDLVQLGETDLAGFAATT